MRQPKKMKKAALSQTTEHFANKSSIHGVSYIFNKHLTVLDRLLWTIVVFASLAIAAVLAWDLWIQWENEQVRKNLKIHIAWAHGMVYVTETMCKQYSNIVYFGGGVVK